MVSTGCVETRYVIQAGLGQLDLATQGRPVSDVLADPETDDRTRYLLELAMRVRAFAKAEGMSTKGNYREYVDLDRSAVVWFLAAAPPLSLEPVTWNFPIAGSFPYLGWFDEGEARKMAGRLRRDGKDVFLREVHAFSTGGWFHDPILSTMLQGDDTAHLGMVNTLLHELTHANFFMPDQATYNESVASFVGDNLAERFLIREYGESSIDVEVYRLLLAEDRTRVDRLTAAYRELEALYASTLPDAGKLAKKAALMNSLRAELELTSEPNNASMQGFKTYNSGFPEMAELLAACGSWPRFFDALATVKKESFAKDQEEEIGPVISALVPTCRDSGNRSVKHAGRSGSSSTSIVPRWTSAARRQK